MTNCDAVIVGAGPYGLSAAAHLKTIPGLQVKVFGEAMALWKHSMPKGMFLRSPLSASHIAHPKKELTFNAFATEHGTPLSKPIPVDRFIAYGDWFQRKAVPDLDPRNVAAIESNAQGFKVTTNDGESIQSRRVVIATGPGACKWRPPEYDGLPASMASHSCDHHDLGRFAGKRVLVIGAGQSALENGALLHEAGAHVEIIVRSPNVHWLRWRSRLFAILPVGRVLYSPRDVGPAGVSQLIARPELFRKLPRDFQDWATRRSVRPAGALWLMERLKHVPIRTSLTPTAITQTGGQLRVRLSDGTEQMCDHIMFATGFRIDLAKYNFLTPQLLGKIDQVKGYPRLKTGLESSVPGLHFLGALSGWSFGPVARFVSGTFYSPDALMRNIAASN
jgi:FAD-dependent urate hydroxylase